MHSRSKTWKIPIHGHCYCFKIGILNTKLGSFLSQKNNFLGCGGKNEQETRVYFWALFPYFKTLLATKAHSALLGLNNIEEGIASLSTEQVSITSLTISTCTNANTATNQLLTLYSSPDQWPCPWPPCWAPWSPRRQSSFNLVHHLRWSGDPSRPPCDPSGPTDINKMEIWKYNQPTCPTYPTYLNTRVGARDAIRI